MTTQFYETEFYVHLDNFHGPRVWTTNKLPNSKVEAVILGHEVEEVTYDFGVWLYRLKAVQIQIGLNNILPKLLEVGNKLTRNNLMSYKYEVTLNNLLTGTSEVTEVFTEDNDLKDVRQAVYAKFSDIMLIRNVKLIWSDCFQTTIFNVQCIDNLETNQ